MLAEATWRRWNSWFGSTSPNCRWSRVRLGKALQPYLDTVDLVQSVHRELFVGLRDDRFQIASPEKLIALALTIVRRKAARHWRKLRRQQWLNGDGSADADLLDLFASLTSSSDDAVMQATLRDQADTLMRDLEPTDRRLIELRLNGFNTAEAALELNLNPNVLRVRLSRARKRLADQHLIDD